MDRMDWTRTLVDEPGLRPTTSEAFMPIRPTAIAAPKAAKPTCTFPIMGLFVVPFSPTLCLSEVGPAKLINQSCVAAAPSASCWQISRVKTAVNNVKTRACTKPTSRSEEHTSELQSLRHLVCRLLLE